MKIWLFVIKDKPCQNGDLGKVVVLVVHSLGKETG